MSVFGKYKQRWVECAKNPGFYLDLMVSSGIFFLSLVINQYAIIFATERASNPVADIILSNIPRFDVDELFVYGTAVVAAYAVVLCLTEPRRLPFVLRTVALFFVIRSIFVSLTHLAPFEPHLVTNFSPTINHIFFGGDRFFSGHTGLPFLAALAFWHIRFQRYFFLSASIFFAVIVLLGHLHYSIDVLSAFFITYTIFSISVWLFPKDYEIFKSKNNEVI